MGFVSRMESKVNGMVLHSLLQNIAVGGGVFGEFSGVDLAVAQGFRQPDGHGAVGLDLHQRKTVGEDLLARGAQGIGKPFRRRKAVIAVAHGGIEGDPQVGVLYVEVGLPLAGDEYTGDGAAVKLHGVVDLPHDLGILRGDAALEVGFRLRKGGGNTALIDHALVFLLDLEEYLSVLPGDAVAADAKLFLVGGGVDGVADQEKVGGVQIQTADGAFAVGVGDEMLPDDR